MGYSLQALIAQQGVFPSSLPEGLEIIELQENMQMIPLGTSVQERYGIPFLPLTDDGATEMLVSLRSLCQKIGADAKVAYIEAEIFGGMGTQANAIIERNGDVSGPVIAVDAINSALRCLGVKPIKGQDEFDAVGLGKHRDTDNWLPKH